MRFENRLIPGKLVRRYKRFLADIILDDGHQITAHCPNSGSMKGCDIPGSKVFVSHQPSPKRKLQYTWELVYAGNSWVGINTILANRIVQEALLDGKIQELNGFKELFREKNYGHNSRIDILLKFQDSVCYVEIKNVTLVENERALFPDAITKRGQKHIEELIRMKKEGHRAVLLFLIQREDASVFAPADEIDSVYGMMLRMAFQHGIEILPYQCKVSPTEISIYKKLPVEL